MERTKKSILILTAILEGGKVRLKKQARKRIYIPPMPFKSFREGLIS